MSSEQLSVCACKFLEHLLRPTKEKQPANAEAATSIYFFRSRKQKSGGAVLHRFRNKSTSHMAMDEESALHATPLAAIAPSTLVNEEQRKSSIAPHPQVTSHIPSARPSIRQQSDATLPTSWKKQQENPPPILLHP